ncbi:MAG: hypothetical protein AB1665_09260, partial [Candidatus Thermoplasmatota archaeon]
MRRWDDHGRVPFAIVAVLLLALSVVSVGYITHMERLYAEERSAAVEISRMNTAAEIALTQIETAAYTHAVLSIENSTRAHGNISLLDQCFTDGLEGYVNASFPMEIGSYTVSVEDLSALVMQEERAVEDRMERCQGVQEGVEVKDEDGVTTSGEVEVLDTASVHENAVAKQPVYFTVAGIANLSVASSKGLRLSRSIEFEKEVRTPYPFMCSKQSAQALAATGEMSPV